MPALLLDTCAMIWLAADEPVAASATAAMDEAYRRDEAVWVSPISAWEIGILAARGRMTLSTSPQAWFRKALAQIGVALCVLEPETLIESSFLPGAPPRDPADRIVIATARALGLQLVTRDRAILAYADAGHVAAIPC
jgi:PIN domain nuclease of toxin-antitoxin system